MSVHFKFNEIITKKEHELCFYCHNKIEPKNGFIAWDIGDKIALHERCAYEFMAHLGSDLIKLKHEKRSFL